MVFINMKNSQRTGGEFHVNSASYPQAMPGGITSSKISGEIISTLLQGNSGKHALIKGTRRGLNG